jgi:uncharacterized protein (TIGR04255 family)
MALYPEITVKAQQVLRMPTVTAAHFQTNYIRQAVCEFRFPTLYELEDDRPPATLSRALRHSYPIQELSEQVRISGGPTSRSNVHLFKSKKQHWSVSLRSSSVTLETTKYDSFPDFKARLSEVLNAVKPVIDADYFTRIGLRYINAVPFDREKIAEWVNPALVTPLSEGLYGDPDEHSGRVSGKTAVGGYLLQHGISMQQGTSAREYALDFDFFAEVVDFGDALDTVQQLHDLEFSMFSWTLGPAAIAKLGSNII